ncbi:MAG: heat-shock protein Hsp70 [Alteromonadaceae bacterium]|nr:MAG: heat-shock protein Hsp70 [Alteromonadaceae bacterium]
MSQSKYIGIDLGTSNSAVSVFDGDEVKTLVNARGEINTPSVVRVKGGSITVGAKAQKHLHSDSKNTFKEFKRLMGTQSQSEPDDNGKRWLPEELSSEVLKALKAQVERQENCQFDKVVITVPALFELPQSKATAEAARMAGFKQVELLPEPVASGLSSGWSEQEAGAAWLIYDLGGGTFDVSLIESRDGLLRVIGHDGDNFLGGRDIDRTIVNWLIEQLVETEGLQLDHKHSDYSSVIRHFESAAENAKIKLSTLEHSVIELEFEYDNEDYEVDIALTRDELKTLCAPIIDRSIQICQRLLSAQGLQLEQLKRVVLVGGPAHMPIVQSAVQEKLAPLAQTDHDPMCLVANGAALYAATINLGCEPAADTDKADEREHQLWLQYPSVCTELNPTIMGRVIDESIKLSQVQICTQDGSWQSPMIPVDDSNIFMLEVSVKAGGKSSFIINGFDQNRQAIDLAYQAVHIVHGITISDPPLSRSIGLALADGSVKTFIDRGTPLPAKRSFAQSTIETLVPGSGQKLQIPIVQGERKQARFCRKVGVLVIDAAELKAPLPVGATIEITIEVDRGGDMRSQAFLPQQNKIIHGVAQLFLAKPELSALKTLSQNINTRMSSQLQQAFRSRDESALGVLNPLTQRLQLLLPELLSMADDVDGLQRISRELMEIESELELFESREQLSELMEECEMAYFGTDDMVKEYGRDTDKRVMQSCAKQFEQAMQNPRQGDIERLIERLNQVYHSAYKNKPEFWADVFQRWASHAHAARDPVRADKLVRQGNEAVARKEYGRLQAITNELYDLIPEQQKSQQGDNYDSGIY